MTTIVSHDQESHCDDLTDNTTDERHPSFVDSQYLCRMCDEIREIIDQYVSYPPSNHNPEHRCDDKGIEILSDEIVESRIFNIESSFLPIHEKEIS